MGTDATSEATMQVQELGHAVLYVRDLEKSRHFYGDILGFTQIGGHLA